MYHSGRLPAFLCEMRIRQSFKSVSTSALKVIGEGRRVSMARVMRPGGHKSWCNPTSERKSPSSQHWWDETHLLSACNATNRHVTASVTQTWLCDVCVTRDTCRLLGYKSYLSRYSSIIILLDEAPIVPHFHILHTLVYKILTMMWGWGDEWQVSGSVSVKIYQAHGRWQANTCPERDKIA